MQQQFFVRKRTGFIRVQFLFSLLCFLIFNHAFSQSDSAIRRLSNPDGWLIQTKSSVYQLTITANKKLLPVFYGPSEEAAFTSRNAGWYERVEEVPVRGGLANKSTALEVVFADGVRDADLQYVSGEVVQNNGRSTLKIVQTDKIYPLQITTYIRVLPEYDVLEKWMEVGNTAKKGNIKIEKLLSGGFALPANEYTLTQWSGTDLNEFQHYESLLTPGVKLIENRAFKSNPNAPWFAVQPKASAGEKNSPTWFGSLHYSGNWQLVFDKAFANGLQVLGGMNFWDTEWNLKPGMKLETPKLTIGFTPHGADGASQCLAAYVRHDVLPPSHRNVLRPVLYNSWEATYYSVSEQNQLELAQKAKELGAELFVIDDGWFRGRTDGRSQSGLGNWDVDKNKFPNGLTPVIKKVHELGMQFGLWVEPENVNPNSDVAKAHPDWIFQVPGRTGNVNRKILNLANEAVYQHLLETFTRLLKENEIDFIKWDQNNALSEPGWSGASTELQREARIRHITNVYRLVEELRRRFPKVLFESCSGGGGRVDLGMLSRMDQTWLSDNTDPVDRLYIQYGFLEAMPANAMVSWVTSTTRHQPVSLDYRFDVSMSGVLGIGSDIRKMTPADVDIARKKIALYKEIRPLVQQGILHKLVSPFESNRCALQYNSDDSKQAVLFCYNMAEYLNGSQPSDRGSKTLKLEGLNPAKKYRLQKAGDSTDKGTVYPGDFLMNIGLAWPVKNAYQSLIFTLKQID
ncbi:alpha-galactosidase [Flavisolibacter ginsenosidimutans]|uniref:Alpha-galactosidase n=1 Tax=Flavisolibacter ginsenosidimutans TaxID=661481 RepID=A0A5B8UCI5_9BACT|nr:alpha-galactosidase [Flavisolibacter ginsenosidimutans]QEC54377.1 alpha-galactosidase [Flavisolibacter ginsenosidimutans]